jgi:2-polyprenyl-3-methyl-5-hydroxy-6-metoxy-1,4-benzoquinol methylase
MFFDGQAYPELQQLLDKQLSIWPEHETFLKRRFKDFDSEHLAFANRLASQILVLTAGELDDFCRSYRWICEAMLEEELYFRRNNTYRLKTFAEAIKQVYSRPEVMKPYMRGLLMTQVWWSNHTSAMVYYVKQFLAGNKEGYRHLEVGPGHGLLLFDAVGDTRCASVTAWDVSQTSIDETRLALRRLGASRSVDLELRDLFRPGPSDQLFDSVVFSEVLEHLDRPAEALAALRRVMQPGGRIFIDMPINSPAPDHIFLLRSPEDVQAFVASAGFKIVDSAAFPATAATVERARKQQLTISCVVVAQAPN